MAQSKLSPSQFTSGRLSADVVFTLQDSSSTFQIDYSTGGQPALYIQENVASGISLQNIDGTELLGVDDNGITFSNNGAEVMRIEDRNFRMFDLDKSHYLNLKAPDTITTNFTLILPDNDGAAGQYLKTDGSGVLSWDTPAGGGSSSGAAGAVQYSDGSGGFSAEEANFFYDSTKNQLLLANSTTGNYQLEIDSDFGGIQISPVTTGLSGALNAINVTGSATGSMNINISNTNTGSSANSRLQLSTAAAGGDPFTSFSVGDITYVVGTDNSDNDTFRIGIGTNPSSMTSSSINIRGNKIGVSGQTSPTAALHLPAGTASAESAPLKFTTGTALTTPEDGALEYHGSHLYFTIGSTRYQLDQQAASISDGDKGDITVSSGGTVWTIDNLAVTDAKINDVSVSKLTSGTVASTLSLTSTASSNINLKYNSGVNGLQLSDGLGQIVLSSPDGNKQVNANNTSVSIIDGTASWEYVGGVMRIYDSDSTHYIGFQTPATGSLTTSYTLTFPTTDGNANQVLTTDGSGVLSWTTPATGDVVGPGSSVNDRIVLFDGITGKLIKDGGKTLPAGSVVGTSDSQTLTAKRIDPRVTSNASVASPTPDVSTTDIYILTAQAATASFQVPTGTPVQGTRLLIRIKDNGTTRTLNWDAIYRGIGVSLPSATVASKTLYLGFIYNSTDTKWDLIALAEQA